MKKYQIEYLKNNTCKILFVYARTIDEARKKASVENIYDITDITGINKEGIKSYCFELANYNKTNGGCKT